MNSTSPVNFRHGSPKTQLSARKLAARLWQLRFLEVSSFPHASFHFSNSKFESSPPRSKEDEEVTIRGPTSNVLAKIHRERKSIGDSVVSALLSELLRAQSCINKLKAEHKSSKKKLEKLLWKRRELQKTRAMLEDLKDKLARERRSRERMESLNTKLVQELAEAKQFMINYEEEKKKRELIEEVCNELAMQIGEDKAKLEEMEEERKMFRMAELWREESIQMKLLDAKLALEDKYNQMIHLIAHLQTFLRSRGDELGTMELIKQAAESVNIGLITEFSFDFTKSNDIFPIYGELRKPPNLIGPSSTVHILSVSPDEDCLNNNCVLHQSSTSSDYSTGLEVTNFCSPSQRRSTSLDNVNQNKNRLGSELGECCENTDDGCYNHYDSLAQQNSEDPTYDKCEGRLPTSSIQSGGIASTFLCKGSGESGFRQWELLGQPNFEDSVNPHITRGMKGCIEWPRGIPKINSKVIPLEERVRKQKSQLQHILKPQA